MLGGEGLLEEVVESSMRFIQDPDEQIAYFERIIEIFDQRKVDTAELLGNWEEYDQAFSNVHGVVSEEDISDEDEYPLVLDDEDG